MIRAWARLVGIRRGRFDVAAPAGRLAGCCWLCCVAVGWRLCACRCDRLALALRVVGFRPAGCGLWWAVWLACWLEALPLSCAGAGGGCQAVPCWGAIGGVYIKLPGDYTGRIKPLPARLAALLAVCFCRLHRRGSGGHRLASALICRSRWWTVFPEAAPGAFACVCLLPVGLLRWAALHGKRHGTPHGKRRRKCA